MKRAASKELPDFWSFQTCAEFGGYMTCDVGSRCFFSQGLLTLPMLMSFCPDSFNITTDAVTSNVAATNLRYGGSAPAVTCAVFANGEIDPFSPMGVLEPSLDRDLYAFLRAETAPNAVMMTRVPWQLQWYSDRPALMIPADADATTILRLAKHYQVRYLVLDSLQRPNAATRAVLTTMIAAPQNGFELRYRTKAYPVNDHGRQFTMVSEVYEFPPDYQSVAPIW